MDVSRLRRALRLVHCLQKERGASCAVLACSDDDNDDFEQAMMKARTATDVASQRLYKKMPPALAKIRLQLDQRTSTQVHRMLVIYNTLISSVEHEYVQTCMNASRQTHSSSSSSKPLLHSQRSKSTNDFAQYSQEYASAAASTNSNVSLLQPPMDIGARSADPALFAYPLPPTASSKSPPSILLNNNNNNNNNGRYYSPQVRASKHSPRLNRRTKQTSFTALLKDDNRTLSLLNLLACLVRLKESTGMQRAVISSMRRRRHDEHALLTSLILQVENQRKLLHELQVLPQFDVSLQTLVQDSVTMGKQLESLQQQILNNFNFQQLQQEIQSLDVWNMITVYVDKLYALELLLVEELEYCQDEQQEHGRSATPTPEHHEGENPQATLMQQVFGTDSQVVVADLPADVVKQKVVEYMKTPPPPPPPRLGESNSAPLLHSPPQPSPDNQARKTSLLSGMLSQQQQRPTEEQPSKEWQISLDELQFRKRIGRGTAGTTYLAKWSGQTVAVKVAALSDMGLDGWKAEIQALQRLHHPNVIRLLGSVYNENPLTYCLVLEYCNAGDLSSALQEPTPPDFFVRVATDIANGMSYLHKRGVLHRDIKPSNVLLDGNGNDVTAKVSDFGVATTYEVETDGNRTAETGTYRWMAPEIIRHERYSLEADVYSFAILCWQLLTREVPFANVSPLEAAGKVALELARPPFPEGTPACIQDLIATCWAEEPSSRLSFSEISTRLSELDLSVEERTWLQAPMGHAVYDKQHVVASSVRSTSQGQVLQVPSVKPPLTTSGVGKQVQQAKDPRRASGFRRIFPKQKK